MSRRAIRMKANDIREILKWISQDVISFGGGLPDPSTFPRDEIKEISRDVIEKYGDRALQYSLTEGIVELREELVRFAARDGMRVDGPDSVLVTVGSQEAIELIGRVFIDEGDTVITENPTYLATLQSWSVYGPRIVGIPMDDEGMRTDVLEERLRAIYSGGGKVKLIYTVPTAQNPTGISMSVERRKHLLELASRYDIYVIEDNPYSYYVFEGSAPPHLKALDEEGRVIYLSTASKIFVPGLRVGWVLASGDVVRWLSLAKQAVSLHTSTLSQYLLLEALRRGIIERTVPRVRELYRRKRDAMLSALERHMPNGVQWTKPIGGMFIWVTLPSGIDARSLLKAAIVKYRVAYVPGAAFHVDGTGQNTMRLNFTYPSFEEIEIGVNRLSLAVREAMEAGL